MVSVFIVNYYNCYARIKKPVSVAMKRFRMFIVARYKHCTGVDTFQLVFVFFRSVLVCLIFFLCFSLAFVPFW